MGKLGWSYPAGCDGPPEGEGRCPVCGIEAGACECPECPVCGEAGNPRCYEEHGLKSPGDPAPKSSLLSLARFAWLYATAWARGLAYRWPRPVPIPPGYTGAVVSLVSWRDCLGMYRTDGRWEPWALRRVKGLGCTGWSGTFRVPMTPEEVEWERRHAEDMARAADEYYAEEARRHAEAEDLP